MHILNVHLSDVKTRLRRARLPGGVTSGKFIKHAEDP
jgi:hypothetical protein